MKNIYEIQKSNREVYNQFSIKDILFVYYKCTQQEKLIRCYSPYNQFTFAIHGQKTYHQADNSVTISKTSGFLLKRSSYNEEINEDVAGLELMVFYLKDDYLKDVFNELRPHLPLNELPDPPKDMIIMMEIDDRIRNCYTSLIPYFGQKLPIPESIVEIKFKELMYNILIHPSNRPILSYINSLVDGYVTPLWEIMEKNFMYELKLSDYAMLTNRSLASFKREFRNYYETSPGKWLVEKRLGRAKRFLETSQKNISEIAFENGFKNVSHFSRKFKEHYGNSPAAYRKAFIRSRNPL